MVYRFPMASIDTAKSTRLNPKKLAFINAYTQLGSETFHNGARSARFAGYKDTNAACIAHELTHNPIIANEIAKREQEQWDWNFDRWTQEVLKSSAECDGKHSNRPRYLELIGKSKGFIKENQTNNNLYILNADDLNSMRERIAGNSASTKTITCQDKSLGS